MSSRRQDEALARRVAAARLLDREVLARALAEADARRAQGRPASFAELLVSRGYVSAGQLQRLREPGEAVTEAAERAPALELPRLPTRLRAGQTLCGCVVDRELGRGAMGAVYLGRAPDGRQVALKVLLGVTFSERQRERFRREAAALRSLQHPGIVQILDSDLEGDPPCMALEYVPGGDLADALEVKPRDADALLEVLAKVCRAVHKTHSRGIVHRDLKPANILMGEDGQPKVTDFGLVRDLSRDTRLTATGSVVGTLPYMAPEHVRGSKDVGPAEDVYALGVILFEVLTGGSNPAKLARMATR